nr:GGDEF domain-containing protein [Paenibacillus hamazuiensis]
MTGGCVIVEGKIVKQELFAEELSVLRNAQADLQRRNFAAGELQTRYELLVDEYAKLLRTTVKLARVGDIHGQNLVNQNKRLKEQSETDYLTGLFNRRKFWTSIPVWAAEGRPFVLMLLDIDRFKQVNDLYGHLSGDEVLRSFAGILTDQSRSGDLVCRSGGEEFAVLIRDVTVSQAVSIAERMRLKVESTGFRLASGEPIRITVSIGLVEYADGMSAEQMLLRADDALYLSKQQGRNRVSVCPAADNLTPL